MPSRMERIAAARDAAIVKVRERTSLRAQLADASAERDSLRTQLADKLTELAAANSLAARWRALADMTYWAELASGATVKSGDRVRYLGRTYECTQEHAKALLLSPQNGAYWQKAEEP